MSLDEIKANWTKTDELIYKTPEIKLASIQASKNRVSVKKNKVGEEDKESPFAYPDDKI